MLKTTPFAVLLALPLCGALAQAAPQTAKSADTFVHSIGVNIHAHYFDTAYDKWDEIILPRLKESGIRHVRDTAVDTTVAKFYERHQSLAAAGIKGTFLCDPGTMSTARLGQFVPRVGNLEAFEGPNEFDARGWADWQPILYDYQRRLFWAVKNDPELRKYPLLGPSLVDGANFAKLDAFRPLVDGKPDLTAPPIRAWMDMGSFHPYPGAQFPSSNIDGNVKMVRKAWGDLPLLPTETGYHNAIHNKRGHIPTSETATAKYLPRLFAEYFNRGFPRTFSYEFIDDKPDRAAPEKQDSERHFGLLRNDGTPKPAFTALKNLIALVKEEAPKADFAPQPLDFTLGDAPKSLRHLLLQKSNGEWNLLLWQKVSSWDTKTRTDIQNPELPLTLTLNTPVKSASVYRPGKGATALQTLANASRLELQVPDEVIVVRLASR